MLELTLLLLIDAVFPYTVAELLLVHVGDNKVFVIAGR